MTAPSEPVRPADEETVQVLAEVTGCHFIGEIDGQWCENHGGADYPCVAGRVVASEPWQRRREDVGRLSLLAAKLRGESERAARLQGERDEARAAVARVKALAESWRYKGEFGWGSWQEGYGPDPASEALDHAASLIGAALAALRGDAGEASEVPGSAKPDRSPSGEEPGSLPAATADLGHRVGSPDSGEAQSSAQEAS